MINGRRVAIYCRVSTTHQTVENQLQDLRAVAEKIGWQIVAELTDNGISGAKGKDQRPPSSERHTDRIDATYKELSNGLWIANGWDGFLDHLPQYSQASIFALLMLPLAAFLLALIALAVAIRS